MKLCLSTSILLLILSFNSLAQTEEKFSLLDFENGLKTIETVDFNVTLATSCQKSEGSNQTSTQMSCSIPKDAEKKKFIERSGVIDLKRIPEGVKSEINRFANIDMLNPKGNFYIIAKARNDMNIPPLGLVAYIFTQGQEEEDSFDKADTHSTEFELGYTTFKGDTWSIRGATHLYTQPIPGEAEENIHFTEDNILALGYSTKNRGKKISFSMEAGMQTINRETPSKGGSASQQNAFHQLLTDLQDTYNIQYNHLPNGQGIRRDVFGNFTVGLAHTLYQKGRCELRTNNEFGITASTNTDVLLASMLNEVHFDINSKKKKARTTFSTGIRTTAHPGGIEYRPFGAAVYQRKWGGIKSQIDFPKNKQINYVGNNYAKHPISSIAIFVVFGKGNKNKNKKK